MTELQGYQAIRHGVVLGAVADRRQVLVSGPDRQSFLQGFLTNDVAALLGGTGCYAAWLTPQGRMLADLHVFESGDMTLLDVPGPEAEAIAERLEQFHFAEQVEIAPPGALGSLWLHGPGAAELLTPLVHITTGEPLAAWAAYTNRRGVLGGEPVVVARVDQLGVPGFVVFVATSALESVANLLVQHGAIVAAPEALEAARIEAGYPVFGLDMTDEVIPLEAGIENRAISFTKGCYVGQEVVIRIMHRGHGRVARKLVGLRIDGPVPAPGTKLFAGGQEVGFVTSAAMSPRFGSIALGYVQRDHVEPGSRVEVAGAPTTTVIVTTTPMS
jgi:folate-binding protein YgfZ